MRKQNPPSGAGAAGPSHDDAPFVERDERDRAARQSRVSDNAEPSSRGLPHQQHDEAEPYGTSAHTTPPAAGTTTPAKNTATPAQPKSPPAAPRSTTGTRSGAGADTSGRTPTPERTPRTGEEGKSLLGSSDGEALQSRFRDALASFVDSPADAVSDADDIAAQVVKLVTDAVQAKRSELEQLHRDAGTDTEKLRLALHKYRAFIEGMSKL